MIVTRAKKNPVGVPRVPLISMPARSTVILAALLAFGVVLWQHVLHVNLVVRSSEGFAAQLPHVLRDGALAFPVALAAVVLGRYVADLITDRGRDSMFVRAAAITQIFMVAMVVAVPVHTRVDVLLGGAAGHAGPWLMHAIRDGLVGQFAALPLLVFGLYAIANPHRVFSSTNAARIGIAAAVAASLSVAGTDRVAVVVLTAFVALCISLDRIRVNRIALALVVVAATFAFPSLGADFEGVAAAHGGVAVDAAGCEVDAPEKSFDVAAINVRITLNAFGDNDPNGLMYVLEDRIADVRSQELTGAVSPGLRQDPIQPLAIRANLGDCLTINFTNRLSSGDASMNVYGLPFTAENAGGNVGLNPNTLVAPGQTISYTYPIPENPEAERAYNFRSLSDPRQTAVHGLFGTLIVEPTGSVYLDPEDRTKEIESGWEAIIVDPSGVDFREVVIMMHEVGDESYNVFDINGEELPEIDDISGSYRPGSRAINYRSEPFRNRLLLGADKSLAYSSYTFGDPSTPIARSYLGEPTKTRLTQPGTELFHVYHLHGGGNRWRRNPGIENSDFATGLQKQPVQDAQSTRLDSQALAPGESYNLETECGAGGCQQAAGDFLFHCHIGAHYVSGMWAMWRVMDTVQDDLAEMPADPGYVPPPISEAGSSLDLIGSVVEGKTLVAAIDVDLPNEVAIEDFIAEQLPPQGVTLDDQDATVWDWQINYVGGDLTQPLFIGEPDDTEVWANYESPTPGVRPELQFNLTNGRQTWPQFKPQLGKRPPFAPGGHGGTPWLGPDATPTRPDGLCPTEVDIPGRRVLTYPVTAIDIPIQVTPTLTNPNGMLFVLNEDIDDVRSGAQPAEPFVLRSNVGDCTDLLLTSQQEDINHGGFAKVNIHTHFVQFDPQASDGVITGYSYEQSVRPYATENRTLTAAAAIGDTVIDVTNTNRLRVGIYIGVGLGEGMCDPTTGLQVANPDNDDWRCTEIRKITALTPTSITIDAPLVNVHALDEAVGVEFVQYRWYSDVDSGTVFFHDHVDFNNWDNGLFGAHVIEPQGSTYNDPETGAEIRTGTVADIRTPANASVGAGQQGSFRELMVFLANGTLVTDGVGEAVVGTINMKADPPEARDPEFPFSSVVNGDPITPVFRTYVGDDVVIRALGVVERMGALRVTGHQFAEERFRSDGAVQDTSSIGVSEREDLVLLGGAGGEAGLPGDFLFYNTLQEDFESGAWGIMRVHDTAQGDLMTLPDTPAPPVGPGFPQQTVTGLPPLPAVSPGNPCPPLAPVRSYSVSMFDAPVGALFGDTMYALAADEADITNGIKPAVPLVLRVNEGDCLVVSLTNNSGDRGAFNVAKLVADVQGSGGNAVGFNTDSTVDKDASRVYRFFANDELGTSMFFNLAEPRGLTDGGWGAIIVEPVGAAYLSPVDGSQIESGVEAIIFLPNGESFREFVALYQDEDDKIGANEMPYPTIIENFSGINYSGDLLRTELLTGRMDTNPVSDAFDSAVHGDPVNLWEAYVGDPVRVRIGVGSGLQAHAFGLEGHRFPWEPNIPGSEELYVKGILPGESFDLELIDGAGGGIESGADYLFGDNRLPFLESGMWGIFRTFDTTQPGLQALPTEPPGLLRVTTSPPTPSQIVIDGIPRDRWALDWVKLVPGSYEVCFTDIEGWDTPPCETAVVTSFATTEVEGSFTQNGTLRVITSPAVPSTISIDGNPANDWGMWTDLTPGAYTVCFGDVADFAAPPCEVTNVVAGATVVVTGTFTSDPGALAPVGDGLLRVTSMPGVPTQISIDGVTADRWGLNWVKVAPGLREVCFGDVTDFTTPGCQTVQVDAGEVTVVNGVFEARAILRVTTSPPHESTISANGVPLDDWGVWNDIAPGAYTICFGEANGFAPPCQNVNLVVGVNPTVVGVWP